MTRIVVREGDLVCLTHSHQEAACRAQMGTAGRTTAQPKWKPSASGNATTTFYDARVTVFGSRGGFTFVVTDGSVSGYSAAFATRDEAKEAAALSLAAMRQSGSWRQEWRDKQDAETRALLAQTCDLEGLGGEFVAFLWELPDQETTLAWGWLRDNMQWLPKSVVYETSNPDVILVRRSWLQEHGCPLGETCA